VSLREVKFGV